MPHEIHPTALVGVGLRMLQGFQHSSISDNYGPVSFSENVYIGPYALIGENVTLGLDVIIDAFCKLDPNVIVGDRSLIVYAGVVGSGAVVGVDCVVGGNVSEGTKVGDRCRTFGRLIHSHVDSTMSWDHHETPEPSPVIHADSFIGHDASVIGAVTIGPRSYVCAGAIVTRDVPPHHIASGVNQIVHHAKWPGRLALNPMFAGNQE